MLIPPFLPVWQDECLLSRWDEIIWKAPLAAVMRRDWRQAPALWCVIKHGSWEGRGGGLVAVGALETGCSFSAAKLRVWLIMEQQINNIAGIRKSTAETQGAEQDWGSGSAWAALLQGWLLLAQVVPRWAVAAGRGGRLGGGQGLTSRLSRELSKLCRWSLLTPQA